MFVFNSLYKFCLFTYKVAKFVMEPSVSTSCQSSSTEGFWRRHRSWWSAEGSQYSIVCPDAESYCLRMPTLWTGLVQIVNFINIHVCVCVYVYTPVCVCLCVCMCIHKHTHTYTHTYVCVCVYSVCVCELMLVLMCIFLSCAFLRFGDFFCD